MQHSKRRRIRHAARCLPCVAQGRVPTATLSTARGVQGGLTSFSVRQPALLPGENTLHTDNHHLPLLRVVHRYAERRGRRRNLY